MSFDAADFQRLEGTVNKIAEAVSRLVLIEERQAVQRGEIDGLRTEMIAEREARYALKAELDKWVNRGWGAWGVVVAVMSVAGAIGWKALPDKQYVPPPSYSVRDERPKLP